MFLWAVLASELQTAVPFEQLHPLLAVEAGGGGEVGVLFDSFQNHAGLLERATGFGVTLQPAIASRNLYIRFESFGFVLIAIRRGGISLNRFLLKSKKAP